MDLQSIPTDDPSAWKGDDFPAPRSWVRRLTSEMVDEVATAVRAARTQGVPFWNLDRASYPLPLTAPLLAQAYDDLENGSGFTVLAGWPVDDFSYEENQIAYGLVAGAFGSVVVQTLNGDRMIDVVDKSVPYSAESRGYHSTALLPFHTDGTKGEAAPVHVVGLLCLETAESGGLSAIASASALCRTIAQERPDLIPVLSRGFRHHRRGQHAPGEPPLSVERIPVFQFWNDELHCRYNRNPIEWAAKEGELLSETDCEALDYLDAVVTRPGFALSMELQKGDMQFISNFVILHSRTPYHDGTDRKRHLLRLWLTDPTSKRTGGDLLDRFAPPASRFHGIDTR